MLPDLDQLIKALRSHKRGVVFGIDILVLNEASAMNGTTVLLPSLISCEFNQADYFRSDRYFL
jgi:hypothetical protein